MGILLTILQWAIPSGGIGAAIAWLANRKSGKSRAAQTAKDVHDTFRAMYDDVSALLEKTQKKYEEIQTELEKISTENGNLKRVVNSLKRAIQAIQKCPHNMQCPVRDELSVDPNGDDPGPTVKGQRGSNGSGGNDSDRRTRAGTTGHGSAGDNTPAAGGTPPGRELHPSDEEHAGDAPANR